MRIITQQEANKITDVLYYMRRSLNENKMNDEGKLAALEAYITELQDELGKIKERWKEIGIDA